MTGMMNERYVHPQNEIIFPALGPITDIVNDTYQLSSSQQYSSTFQVVF